VRRREKLVVRVMGHEDIDFAVSMTHLEGWLYHSKELERMLRFDPEGSFVYEDRSTIAFITSITYGRTGVIGHLIVSEKARGKRIGETLVKKAIDYMEGRGVTSIMLFSTKQGFGLYKRLGFRPLKEALCIQSRNAPLPTPKGFKGLSRVVPDDLNGICEIDSKLFGDDRSRLIRELYREYPDLCFRIRREGRIVGYGFGRTTSKSNDFGPWACETGRMEDAQALYDSVMSQFRSGDVYLGVFAENQQARKIACRLEAVRTWETTLMVRGEERYTGPSQGLYGPTAFELG
jgi:ribosomal protein S18 acetylase RimI-like enzyme